MKILHLLSSTGIYGAENMVMGLLKELREAGIETCLGIFENNSNAHFAIAEEAARCTDHVEMFPCRGKWDMKAILRLREFIVDNRIDIIHSHKYKTNVYSYVASLFKGTPLVSTCHNWISQDYKMKMYEWVDKKVLDRFDKVIAVSDEVMDKILRSGINYHKVLKIKNGIRIEEYSGKNEREIILAEFGIDVNSIVIGNVGRLDDNKGIDYLLKAVEKLSDEYKKNINVLIAGDGPSRYKLQDKADELGISDKVIFAGFRKDVAAVLSAVDIFVLPSFMEGLPMVLLEAMASHTPVIATRVGDIPHVIKDNETGLLVDAGNEGQLKDAIEHLISNRENARKIAERGYEKMRDEYSSRQMAEQYMNIYDDILRGREKEMDFVEIK